MADPMRKYVPHRHRFPPIASSADRVPDHAGVVRTAGDLRRPTPLLGGREPYFRLLVGDVQVVPKMAVGQGILNTFRMLLEGCSTLKTRFKE